MIRPDLLAQFAGSLVEITDENGVRIGVGRLDDEGVVHAVIDGVEYKQQLSHLVAGEE